MLVILFPSEEDCSILTPVVASAVVSDSITGPASPPPVLNVNPSETVMFVPVPIFELDEFSFEKLKVEPFSIVAELPDPGGSLNTKSGISGPAVTKVWVPSASPPNIIPSV